MINPREFAFSSIIPFGGLNYANTRSEQRGMRENLCPPRTMKEESMKPSFTNTETKQKQTTLDERGLYHGV